ncbi:hypothetical protein FCL40_13830 [Ferrimonas sediminicola]|uniref:Uncharacterized protein n=1 Tax=Ferrimonas sediminicola TaxID=2569538 RepID=A0A4U1BCJ2_9GAMM|nr:hypothetical protein [Ferrimonas sediminicola]TKB48202.1 hypothetical protein FCL40_13830 [Ferrimonas sediminicola]
MEEKKVSHLENAVKSKEPANEKKPVQKSEHSTIVQASRLLTYKKITFVYAATGALFGLGYIAYLNPHVFLINSETLKVWNQAINAILLLVVPFMFGALAAYARVLISGEETNEYYKIIFSSGLIAAFSWMGIKSKVFLTLVSPYVEKVSKEVGEKVVSFPAQGEDAFYSMALVAILVGMFSSNIFIFVNQKVKQLTNT